MCTQSNINVEIGIVVYTPDNINVEIGIVVYTKGHQITLTSR